MKKEWEKLPRIYEGNLCATPSWPDLGSVRSHKSEWAVYPGLVAWKPCGSILQHCDKQRGLITFSWLAQSMTVRVVPSAQLDLGLAFEYHQWQQGLR